MFQTIEVIADPVAEIVAPPVLLPKQAICWIASVCNVVCTDPGTIADVVAVQPFASEMITSYVPPESTSAVDVV